VRASYYHADLLSMAATDRSCYEVTETELRMLHERRHYIKY
jgi:hypothetical protein